MTKIYLFITEFGDITYHLGELPNEARLAEEEGILSIVDITNPLEPAELLGGEWVKVAKDEDNQG